MERIPPEVRSLIRSSINIRNYEDAVSELIYNSLDASSTSIAVRISFYKHKIQIIDNGHGIRRKDMKCIGKKHMTSKCKTLQDLQNNIKTFGFRGEALSSIINMSEIVTIDSLHSKSDKTYSKTFQKGVEIDDVTEIKARPSHGTTISVTNFLYNLGVRQKVVDADIEMENIRQFICKTALIHYHVSFSLRDDGDGKLVLKTHKSGSIQEASGYLFDRTIGDTLVPVRINYGKYIIEGYVAKMTHTNKKYQFVYINKRCVGACEVKDYCNDLLCVTYGLDLITDRETKNPWQNLKKTFNSKKYPIFIMNIQCPQNEYEITLISEKYSVQFKNKNIIKKAVKMFVKKYLKKACGEKEGKDSETIHRQSSVKDNDKNIEERGKDVERVVRNILDKNAEAFGVSQMYNAVRGNPAKRKMSNKEPIKEIESKKANVSQVDWNLTDNAFVTPQVKKKTLKAISCNKLKRKNNIRIDRGSHQASNASSGVRRMRETPLILSQITMQARALMEKSMKKTHHGISHKNVGVNVNIKTRKLHQVETKVNKNHHRSSMYKNEQIIMGKSDDLLRQFSQSSVVHINYNSHKNYHMANQGTVEHNCCNSFHRYERNDTRELCKSFYKEFLQLFKDNFVTAKESVLPESNIRADKNEKKIRKFTDMAEIAIPENRVENTSSFVRKFDDQTLNKFDGQTLNKFDGQTFNKFDAQILNDFEERNFNKFDEQSLRKFYGQNLSRPEEQTLRKCDEQIFKVPKLHVNDYAMSRKKTKNCSAQTELNLYDIETLIQTYEDVSNYITKCERTKLMECPYNDTPYAKVNVGGIPSSDAARRTDKFGSRLQEKKDNVIILETSLSSDHQRNVDITEFTCMNNDVSVYFKSSHDKSLNRNNILEVIEKDSGKIGQQNIGNITEEIVCLHDSIHSIKTDVKLDDKVVLRKADNAVEKKALNKITDVDENDFEMNEIFKDVSNEKSKINSKSVSLFKSDISKDEDSTLINNDSVEKADNHKIRNKLKINTMQFAQGFDDDIDMDEDENIVEAVPSTTIVNDQRQRVVSLSDKRENEDMKEINFENNIEMVQDEKVVEKIPAKTRIVHGNTDQKLDVISLLSATENGDVVMIDASPKEESYSAMQEKNEWVTKVDSLGRVYYVNKRTGMSLFANPDVDPSAFKMLKRPGIVPKGLSPILKLGEPNWVFGKVSNKEENRVSEGELVAKLKHGDLYYTDEAYEDFVCGLQTNVANLTTAVNIGFDSMMYKNIRRFKPGSDFKFTQDMLKRTRIINQVDKKFICAIAEDSVGEKRYLMMFDQHAVHERIQLERLVKEFKSGNTWKSSNLSQPIRLSMDSNSVPLFLKYKKGFESLGITYRCNSLSKSDIDITALPSCFQISDLTEEDTMLKIVNEMICEELDMMKGTRGNISSVPKAIMKIISSKACHTAIKFGTPLTRERCSELLRELSECEVPFQCAHGRPSLTVLLVEDIARERNYKVKKRNFKGMKKYIGK